MTQNNPQEQQLKNLAGVQAEQAGAASQTGQQLIAPLMTGTLPPAAQALVNQILQSNLASDRSTFARLGLSNSTMETSAEDQARNASLAQTFGIEEDMGKLGLGYTQAALGGLAQEGQTTNDILTAQTAQDTALMNMIGQFGKAIGGSAGSAGFGSAVAGAGAAASDFGATLAGMGPFLVGL